MITPGELAPGVMFAVIEGAPAIEDDAWTEQSDAWITVGFFGPSRSDPKLDGYAKVMIAKAVNLPLVLAIDLITSRPAVIDTRKVRLREISKEYAREYVRLFRSKNKPA